MKAFITMLTFAGAIAAAHMGHALMALLLIVAAFLILTRK